MFLKTKKTIRTKKKSKKDDVPKDKVLRAISGVRFRWSGDTLRRCDALIVGDKILIPDKSAPRGSRLRWVQLEANEKVYKNRTEMTRELAREAEVFYCYNDDKIEKVFRKTVPGGGINYIPEGSEGWGSFRYSVMAKEGKLFRTRRQAISYAVKLLNAETAQIQKQTQELRRQVERLTNSK